MEKHGVFKDGLGNFLYPSIKASDVSDMSLSLVGNLSSTDFETSFSNGLDYGPAESSSLVGDFTSMNFVGTFEAALE